MKKQIFAAAILVQILILCGLVYFLFIQQGVKWQINEKDGTIAAKSTICGSNATEKINTALNNFFLMQLSEQPDMIFSIKQVQNHRQAAVLQVTAVTQESNPQKAVYNVWIILDKTDTQIVIENTASPNYTDNFYNEAVKKEQA